MNIRLSAYGLFASCVLGAGLAHAVTINDFPLLSASADVYGDCGPSPRCFSSALDLERNTALVGAAGQLSIFKRQPSGDWTFATGLLDPFAPRPRPYYNSSFGAGADEDGNDLAVSAFPDDRPGPEIDLFKRKQGDWVFRQTIVPARTFGQIGSLDFKLSDGTLVVSVLEVPNVGDTAHQFSSRVLIYRQGANGMFRYRQTLTPNSTTSTLPYLINIDGGALAVGSRPDGDQQGKVYLYAQHDSGNRESGWKLQQTLSAPNLDPASLFGSSIALSGKTIAVSAPGVPPQAPSINPGVVYLYHERPTGWVLRHRIGDPITENDPDAEHAFPAAETPFGTVIALSGRRLLVKHLLFTDLEQGTVIVFERHAGQWTPMARIGVLDEETVLVKGSTALVAETSQSVFEANLNIYDLPPLATAESDEEDGDD
jgi:FG-GAP repeat